MADVFISYSHKDESYAKRIYEFLSSQHISVWYAPYKVGGGDAFVTNIANALADEQEEPEDTKAISENLQSCQIVILLLSANSMHSQWVSKEIAYSFKLKKTVLPLQIDNHDLTPEYTFILSDVHITHTYHMDNESLRHISERVLSLLGERRFTHKEYRPLLYSDLKIHRIACGDPYYSEGHTLHIHLSGHSFFLAPPCEEIQDTQREWVSKHFSQEEICFGVSLSELLQQIPISDLMSRIQNSKKSVLQDFLNQSNGCYFNNKKYGIENIRPFGRTEDEKEMPELWMDAYVTDYYTHRVMKDVCKTLIQEQGDTFLSKISYTDIGPYKILFTSLGINLILTDQDRNGNRSVLFTARSKNASETHGEVKFSISVIEGVSISDYDPYLREIRLMSAVERGLKEELGIPYQMLRLETVRFYELFVNETNLEIGISVSAELKEGFSLESDVRHLRGRDDTIEIAGKYVMPVDEFARFLSHNRNRFLTQAIYSAASYLETIGIYIISRYSGKFRKEESRVISKDGSGSICGDAIVDDKYYVAVIDGATPKGKLLWDGMPGDVFVAQLLRNAIHAMPHNMAASNAMEYLNSKIRDCYMAMGREDISPEERLQASVVIFSAYRREIWSFGDCKFRINQINYDKNKRVDILLGGLRTFCLEVQKQMCLETKSAFDPSLGRQEILPFLRKQSILANKEWFFSYDVLDGGKIYPEHTDVEPVQKGDHVVLASDGYPKLYDSLQETEEYLQKSLKKDAYCMYELRGTKGIIDGNTSYDDRSFISFIVK